MTSAAPGSNGLPRTAREAAPRYLARGWNPIPLPPQKKRPALPDWPNFRFDLSALDEHFPAGGEQNIGLLLGAPSNGLVDVDLDCPEARAAAPFLLPKTDMIGGRESAPDSHWWYIVDSPPEKSATDLNDPTKLDNDPTRHMLELRSTGGQTVVPPSIYPMDLEKGHPEPERCVWSKRTGPARVNFIDLWVAVRAVGAAALLGRYWPRGSRNKAALALAGGLLQAGWEAERAENFIRAVCAAAKDEESQDRVATVAATVERRATDKTATGWPALANLLGQAGKVIVDLVKEWLGVRSSAAGNDNDAPWAPPEPLPDMPSVPPFPIEVFPIVIGNYWVAAARSLGVPVDYIAVPALALLGATCGRALAAEVKRTYKESPLLWCVVVAAPGRAKSPALNFAMGPLMDIAQRWIKEHRERLKEYRADKVRWDAAMKDWKKGGCEGDPPEEPEEPVLQQLVFINFTVESMLRGNAANPRGVVLAKDELASLVQALNQYKSGGKGDDKQNLLSLWAGSAIIINREKDRQAGIPPLTLAHTFGAVAGMIQPDVLPTFRGDLGRPEFVNDGWADRFMISYPDPLRLTGETWETVSKELEDGYTKVYEKLLDLKMIPIVVDGVVVGERPYYAPLDASAAREWERFTEDIAARANALNPLDPYIGVLSKYRHHGLRLIALMHALRLATGEVPEDSPINAETVKRAVAVVWYFEKHGERCLGVGWADRRSRIAGRLLAWLARNPEQKTFSRSDAYLALKDHRDVRNSEVLNPSFRLLIDHNYIRPVGFVRTGQSGPQAERYIVNPAWDRGDLPSGEQGGTPKPPSDQPPSNIRDIRDGVSTESTGEGGSVSVPVAQSGQNYQEPLPRIPNIRPSSDQPSSNIRDSRDGVSTKSVRDQVPEPSPDVQSEQNPQEPLPRIPNIRPSSDRQSSNIRDSRDGVSTESAGVRTVPTTSPGTIVMPGGHLLVSTTAGLAEVVAAINDSGGPVGLDTETTGLDHATDRVRLLSLATPQGTFLLDLFAIADTASLTPVFDALSQVEVIGHNLGFDLPFLIRLGFTPGHVRDTILASQILHAGEITTRHGLKDVAARVLSLTLDKDLQSANWSGPLTPDMLRYAALDAEVPVRIWEKLTAETAAADMTGVLDIESTALPCIAWAAVKGMGFDQGAWETLAGQAEAERDRLREELDARSPNAGSLFDARNWDSPGDVKAAFAALGLNLESTDDDALAEVDHPLAAMVRQYRSAAKRVGTYGREWLRHVAPNGRVYATWKQIGAGASGRMSCKEPNLQQLPRDPRYRRCFVAPPGWVLVKADYSQIELRIAAKITGDRRMLDAYRNGEDLHTLTAQALLGKTEVAKADRQLAKAVNFGLLYGQGAEGLRRYALGSFGVSLTLKEATAHRETFFRTYPGLRAWHRKAGREPVETRTLAGRRRVGVARYTEKLNTPVQGTGADGLKRALALLWQRRSTCPDAFPVLFVHDEIVVECPIGQQEEAAVWVRDAMRDGMAPLIDPIPVEVEVSAGPTWGG